MQAVTSCATLNMSVISACLSVPICKEGKLFFLTHRTAFEDNLKEEIQKGI